MADIGVSTVIRSHEDFAKVVESVPCMFPDWDPKQAFGDSEFPQNRSELILEGSSDSLEILFDLAREQRILDTALDAMSMKHNGDYTEFSISRQAAIVGKLSFVLEQGTMGGEIVVSIRREGLTEWLERSTWHPGRDSVPRSIGDGLSMSQEGSPTEWFDKSGKPTMSED